MTEITELPKLVTVFGGSGFLGRHVVRALAKRGYRVRVACRRPDLPAICSRSAMSARSSPCRPMCGCAGPSTGRSRTPTMSSTWSASCSRAASRASTPCTMTAPAPSRRSARSFGVGLTHGSALGADAESASVYARTKAAGEQAVLSAVPDAVVFRPSIVFGPEDGFFNRFADMARYSPVLPLIGGGHTLFQPVFVGDVAEAIARAVDGKVKGGTVYELGGPEVLTFRELHGGDAEGHRPPAPSGDGAVGNCGAAGRSAAACCRPRCSPATR